MHQILRAVERRQSSGTGVRRRHVDGRRRDQCRHGGPVDPKVHRAGDQETSQGARRLGRCGRRRDTPGTDLPTPTPELTPTSSSTNSSELQLGIRAASSAALHPQGASRRRSGSSSANCWSIRTSCFCHPPTSMSGCSGSQQALLRRPRAGWSSRSTNRFGTRPQRITTAHARVRAITMSLFVGGWVHITAIHLEPAASFAAKRRLLGDIAAWQATRNGTNHS